MWKETEKEFLNQSLHNWSMLQIQDQGGSLPLWKLYPIQPRDEL